MFKKLAQQLKIQTGENVCFPMTSPVESLREQTKKAFLKSLSKHALNLYERKTDINNFTKLALSDPENTSHNDLVNELFAKDGMDNPLDDAFFALSENKKLLKDLGIE